MADRRLEDLPPHDRRSFFAAGIARMLGPLAEYIEHRIPPELLASLRIHLRPPGAIAEKDFLNTCYRCGNCAAVCPVHAISQIRGEGDELDGTPHIEPHKQPCTICDDLSCMKACPSGALKSVGRLDIRMGLAAVDHGLCLRSAGQDCTTCLQECPLGELAIKLDDNGRVRLIDPASTGRGCVGCGLCEQHCPVTPKKAIRVRP